MRFLPFQNDQFINIQLILYVLHICRIITYSCEGDSTLENVRNNLKNVKNIKNMLLKFIISDDGIFY